MKTNWILLCCIWAAGALQAQTEQTLLGKARIQGGFGAVSFNSSKVAGHYGYGAGGGGGLVVGGTMLGLFGNGEVFNIQQSAHSDYTLALGYGGLWLVHSVPTQKAVHLYGSVKIGLGGIATGPRPNSWDDDPDFTEIDRMVFVALPEIGLELNLFHWMRLTGTIGYRYVNGFEGAPGLSKTDLNAACFGLGMRFGWFGHRKAGE